MNTESPASGSQHAIDLTVPRGQDPAAAFQIEALWLDEYRDFRSQSSLIYLQRVRSAGLAPSPGQLDAARQAFEKDLPTHLAAFRDRLSTLEWDLLIEAPSSRPHAGQFASAARSSRPAAPNILIQKSGNKSATRGATSSELAEVFTVNATGPLDSFKQVLIVDDVLASGATVAAIIAALRERGLSAEAKVTLAVALLVFPSPKTPRTNYLEMIRQP